MMKPRAFNRTVAILTTLAAGWGVDDAPSALGQESPPDLDRFEKDCRKAEHTLESLRAARGQVPNAQIEKAITEIGNSLKSARVVVREYRGIRDARKRQVYGEQLGPILDKMLERTEAAEPLVKQNETSGSTDSMAALRNRVDGLAEQAAISPGKWIAQSDEFIERMGASRAIVRYKLEVARAQRNIIRVLCLSGKLSQMDLTIRSAHERRQFLEAAAARKDMGLSVQEFTILSVLQQRSDQLTAEAGQCIGQEEDGYVGDSAVTSDIDATLPKDDPSEYPNDNLLVEPPACSSCIK